MRGGDIMDYEYIRHLAELLFIYGNDAKDVYVEEFEEVRKDIEANRIMLRCYQEIVDAELI